MVLPWMLVLQATTAAFSPPEPVNPAYMFMFEDYPESELRAFNEASVRLAVTVDPWGMPVDCGAVVVPASSDFGQVSCDVLRKRTRFFPAKDIDGKPIWGVWTIAVNWRLTSGGRGVSKQAGGDLRTADLIVSVNKIPSGVTKPIVRVVQRVDDQGRILGCIVATGSGNAKLDTLACQSAVALPFPKITDQNNQRVAAIVSQWVGFVLPTVIKQ